MKAAPVYAQSEAIRRWADETARTTMVRWAGPRVDWPASEERPMSAGAYRSWWSPVAVHGVDPELAERALLALEGTHDWLEMHEWPVPWPDGGYGQTAEFDLYLVSPETFEDGFTSGVWVDVPVDWERLDGAVVHATMRADVDPDLVESCATSLYVQAALMAHDPAEAASWRVATGDYVSWLLHGRWGCSDGQGVRSLQAQPELGWLGADARTGPGSALLLAMLSARNDHLSGNFIRDLWSAAQQHTWEGMGLRASPDLWEVLDVFMNVGEDSLARWMQSVARDRYFVGCDRERRWVSTHVLRQMPSDACVPILSVLRWADLPRRVESRSLELEPFGSSYLVVDLRGAPRSGTLQVWLHGERGVGWSLEAMRVDAEGQERGAVRAPVRPRNPSSFLPIEVIDDRTTEVVIVVTNMGDQGVDADHASPDVHAFRMVLDFQPRTEQPGQN